MKYYNLHPWDVTAKEAVKIQERLRKKIILKNSFREIKRIAGVDASFSKGDKRIFGAVVVQTFPELEVIEEVVGSAALDFPYIPGLLTFREGPVLLSCFEKIIKEPDLILFDGQGIAHPRNMGLAAHIGIILDMPSIGCAKTPLFGKFNEPGNSRGDYSLIVRNSEFGVRSKKLIEDRSSSSLPTLGTLAHFSHFSHFSHFTLGACLRTREGVKPVFVSPGNKVDLKSAIDIVLKTSPKYRIPEPLRAAHSLSREANR